MFCQSDLNGIKWMSWDDGTNAAKTPGNEIFHLFGHFATDKVKKSPKTALTRVTGLWHFGDRTCYLASVLFSL